MSHCVELIKNVFEGQILPDAIACNLVDANNPTKAISNDDAVWDNYIAEVMNDLNIDMLCGQRFSPRTIENLKTDEVCAAWIRETKRLIRSRGLTTLFHNEVNVALLIDCVLDTWLKVGLHLPSSFKMPLTQPSKLNCPSDLLGKIFHDTLSTAEWSSLIFNDSNLDSIPTIESIVASPIKSLGEATMAHLNLFGINESAFFTEYESTMNSWKSNCRAFNEDIPYALKESHSAFNFLKFRCFELKSITSSLRAAA